MYIAVDPGQNVGCASFDRDGTDRSKVVLPLQDFYKVLGAWYKKVSTGDAERIDFVAEDFALRADKAIDQVGSNMPATKCIGAIELIVSMLGDKSSLTLQPPRVLTTALKWAGHANLANKGKNYHVPDDISAYSHGIFYLINKGVKQHPLGAKVLY